MEEINLCALSISLGIIIHLWTEVKVAVVTIELATPQGLEIPNFFTVLYKKI